MRIQKIINEAIELKQLLINDVEYMESVEKAVNLLVKAFSEDKKLLLCGNGGSAADAQHIAAEFSGRFAFDRKPLYAEALHVNTSYLTAVANDYSYSEIYSRMTQASGREGDVLWGISTSGNSVNVVNAMITAKQQGMNTIAFTGQTGGEMKRYADVLVAIPSTSTPRIQESHIMTGHIICELVEEILFKK